MTAVSNTVTDMLIVIQHYPDLPDSKSKKASYCIMNPDVVPEAGLVFFGWPGARLHTNTVADGMTAKVELVNMPGPKKTTVRSC